jgi:hypothetical protein
MNAPGKPTQQVLVGASSQPPWHQPVGACRFLAAPRRHGGLHDPSERVHMTYRVASKRLDRRPICSTAQTFAVQQTWVWSEPSRLCEVKDEQRSAGGEQ